jgi:hypothetical protein
VWISALRIDSNKTVLLPIYWEKGVMDPAGIIPFWGDDSVSVHKWPFTAISASIGGIACAAYRSAPPRNAADFLEPAENCSFLDRKLISALNGTVDGHKLTVK